MTVLGRYLAEAGAPEIAPPGPVFDEFAAPDGSARESWSSLLAGLDEFANTDLRHAQREVARLLEDDNVTYTPSPAKATRNIRRGRTPSSPTFATVFRKSLGGWSTPRASSP